MSAVGFDERAAYPPKGPTIGDPGHGFPSSSTYQCQPSSLTQAQHQQRAPLTEARATVNLDHISQPLRSSKKTATLATDDRENRGAVAAPPKAKDNKNLPRPKDKVRPASPPLIIRDNHRTHSFEKVGFLGEVRNIRPNRVAMTALTVSFPLSGWLCARIRGQGPFRNAPCYQGRQQRVTQDEKSKNQGLFFLSLWSSYSDSSNIALC